MEIINTRKRNTINIVQCLKCYDNFSNFTDLLMIPIIFIFYLVVENKVVKIQNLSGITNYNLLSPTLEVPQMACCFSIFGQIKHIGLNI